MEFIGGIIISFFLGVATSLYFASQSSKELKREASELKQESAKARLLMQGMINGMEQQGWVDAHRNAAGEIDGFNATAHTQLLTISTTQLPVTATATTDIPEHTSPE